MRRASSRGEEVRSDGDLVDSKKVLTRYEGTVTMPTVPRYIVPCGGFFRTGRRLPIYRRNRVFLAKSKEGEWRYASKTMH
jgi:hypothetical protein